MLLFALMETSCITKLASSGTNVLSTSNNGGAKEPYTQSNKPKGFLEKIGSYFSSFFSSLESATSSTKINEKKAKEIESKYGAVFGKIFLKDLSWKSYFFGVSTEEVESAEQIYEKTLQDLKDTDNLLEDKKTILSKLVKINQQLNQLKYQSGRDDFIENTEEVESAEQIYEKTLQDLKDTDNVLEDKKTILSKLVKINQQLNQLKYQSGRDDFIEKKAKALIKKKMVLLVNEKKGLSGAKINHENKTRVEAQRDIYTSQDLNAFNKERRDLNKDDPRANTVTTTTDTKSNVSHKEENRESEYDFENQYPEIENWLEEAANLEDPTHESTMTKATVPSSSNSFNSTTTGE